MNIEIKSRFSDAVLFSGDYASIKNAVVTAVKGDASLRDAYLRGADLGDADLRGADLGGADLRGADLGGAYLGDADLGDTKIAVGAAVVQVGPIGSRGDTLIIFKTEDGLRVRAGCFYGTADDFLASVHGTHGTNAHANNYRNALELAASMFGATK